MGIPHLNAIEDLLKKQSPMSKTAIKRSLGANADVIVEALSYLVQKKKIRVSRRNGIDQYWWKL